MLVGERDDRCVTSGADEACGRKPSRPRSKNGRGEGGRYLNRVLRETSAEGGDQETESRSRQRKQHMAFYGGTPGSPSVPYLIRGDNPTTSQHGM